MKFVGMVLLKDQRNVTAHLDAVIFSVCVNKTTHTTMRVGCACIVGMGLLKVQRNVTALKTAILIVNAMKVIFPA